MTIDQMIGLAVAAAAALAVVAICWPMSKKEDRMATPVEPDEPWPRVLGHNQRPEYAMPPPPPNPPPAPCNCRTRDALDAMLCEAFKRRAAVEQALYDMAAGKLPMPDKAKLREHAQRLGVPDSKTPNRT